MVLFIFWHEFAGTGTAGPDFAKVFLPFNGQAPGGVGKGGEDVAVSCLVGHCGRNHRKPLTQQSHAVRPIELVAQAFTDAPLMVTCALERPPGPDCVQVPVALIAIRRRWMQRNDVRQAELPEPLVGPALADLQHLLRGPAMVHCQLG